MERAFVGFLLRIKDGDKKNRLVSRWPKVLASKKIIGVFMVVSLFFSPSLKTGLLIFKWVWRFPPFNMTTLYGLVLIELAVHGFNLSSPFQLLTLLLGEDGLLWGFKLNILLSFRGMSQGEKPIFASRPQAYLSCGSSLYLSLPRGTASKLKGEKKGFL
ncbi:hypothetical protein Tco_1051842 [Tanacetum coccineum]